MTKYAFFVYKFSILISNNICLCSIRGKTDNLAIYYQVKLILAIPKSGFLRWITHLPFTPVEAWFTQVFNCWNFTSEHNHKIVDPSVLSFFKYNNIHNLNNIINYLGWGTGWKATSFFFPRSSFRRSTIPQGVMPIETTLPPENTKNSEVGH